MNDTKEILPVPFSNMLENYNLSKKIIPSGQKSGHWDVFPEDYEKSIKKIDAWKTFLRNPLSLGFNDSLVNYDNARFSENKKFNNIDPWEKRKKHDYTNLVDEVILDAKEQEGPVRAVNLIFSVCGPDFTINNLETEIGSPQKFLVKYKSENYYCNIHDLSNIYYFWQISRVADRLFEIEAPIIAEIGGGYGGIVTKTKKRYPKARFIIFDLPELLAVQTYYIYKTFPNANILFLKDILERGDKIFTEDFDFIILPGWMIDQVPDKFIDLVINMRSMMEMSLSVINFYFTHIQRTVKSNGLFACFNRYHKKSNSDEDIVLKDYPFDEFWKPIISQTSIVQNHIHDLIIKRQTGKSDFHIQDMLRSVPPF
jgi:putative sugar O-methyltransferase